MSSLNTTTRIIIINLTETQARNAARDTEQHPQKEKQATTPGLLVYSQW